MSFRLSGVSLYSLNKIKYIVKVCLDDNVNTTRNLNCYRISIVEQLNMFVLKRTTGIV